MTGVVPEVPATFTIFTSLPTELQLKIWYKALPLSCDKDGNLKGRLVSLELAKLLDEHTPRYFWMNLFWVRRSSKIPSSEQVFETSIAKACVQSRDVYLDAFKHQLQVNRKGVLHFSDKDIVLFENARNNRASILFHTNAILDGSSLLSTHIRPCFASFKKVAIPVPENMELPGLHGSAGHHLIICFTRLELLLLVFLYNDEGREKAVKKAIVRLLANIKHDRPDYNVPRVESCHRGDLG